MRLAIKFAMIACLIPSLVLASAVEELFDLTLDELLATRVITNADHAHERFFHPPSSLGVLTQKDIRQSAASSMLEVLKLIPGMRVNEISFYDFAIATESFRHLLVNNLDTLQPMSSLMLIMVNDCVVYTRYEGGTFWETLPVRIHNIQKIEITRETVSGMINIVTTIPNEGAAQANIAQCDNPK